MLHIDEVYNQGDLDTKRRIVGVIFPQKLWFENKRPRTIYINEAALRIANKIITSGEVQKKMETFFGLHPIQAPSPAPIAIGANHPDNYRDPMINSHVL